MISRTLASVFRRQSPSSLTFSSIIAKADSTGTGLFMYTSNSRTSGLQNLGTTLIVAALYERSPKDRGRRPPLQQPLSQRL